MTEPKPKHPDENWADSDAKEQLIKDIASGLIKKDNNAKVVLLMHPELYKPWNYDNRFCDRLDRIRDKIYAEKKAAEDDMAAFLHDSELYPVNMTTRTGKPRWNGSQAEKDLKADVKAGLHKQMSAQEFYERRTSYLPFTQLEVYKHIGQEARRRKRMTELIAKCDEEEEARVKKKQKREEAKIKKAEKELKEKEKEERMLKRKVNKMLKEKEKKEKEAKKKEQQKLRDEKKKQQEEAKKKKREEYFATHSGHAITHFRHWFPATKQVVFICDII